MSFDDVCLVHGLWMTGIEMFLIRRRLEGMGFRTARFSYPSVTCTLRENSRRLHDFIERKGMTGCSFVCHSYGGLVVCEYLRSYSHRPCRIVFLGSPVNGSTVAKRAGRIGLLGRLAGKSLEPLRKGCPGGCDVEHHYAMIAGSLNLGLGMFFLHGEADGMVAVEDTLVPWLDKHMVIRCSHLALLFSRQAARLCGLLLPAASAAATSSTA